MLWPIFCGFFLVRWSGLGPIFHSPAPCLIAGCCHWSIWHHGPTTISNLFWVFLQPCETKETKHMQSNITAPAIYDMMRCDTVYLTCSKKPTCSQLSPPHPVLNPVPWQNWMAAYLGYTLRMRTLFRGWPIMVNDTHMRRRRRSPQHGTNRKIKEKKELKINREAW